MGTIKLGFTSVQTKEVTKIVLIKHLFFIDARDLSALMIDTLLSYKLTIGALWMLTFANLMRIQLLVMRVTSVEIVGA